MKNYALMIAGLASFSILAVSAAYAAPACCVASQTSGKVIAAATSTRVNTSPPMPAGSTAQSTSTAATTSTKTQEQLLEVSTSYSPSVITVEKGKPVVLKVNRKDANNCGGTLLIPEFNVRAEIPAGQTTEVKFTPTKAGTFSFTCGMQMMKGQLVVK